MDFSRVLTGAVRSFVDRWLYGERDICVALSGGADSLALTAAAVHAGLNVSALVVDHGLQAQSACVAEGAAVAARSLGADALVLSVKVGTYGGLEAAARAARYEALKSARDGRPVLLGHTLDDQAETVLLGLGRGSGPASLSGMRPWREPWGRPLLGIRRFETVGACEQWALVPAHDPQNADPRFTRVRMRTEVLPLLEDVLGGGVACALARTANLLDADDKLLSSLAADLEAAAQSLNGLDVKLLAPAPSPLRTRVLRRWLIAGGATEPTYRVVTAVDVLLTDWRYRGPVAVGGNIKERLVVQRFGDTLQFARIPKK